MNGILASLISLPLLFAPSPMTISESSNATLSIKENSEYHYSGTNYADFFVTSFQQVASLSLEIYYDSSLITITNSSNTTSDALFDCNYSTPGVVKVSFLFTTPVEEGNQQLFALEYDIQNTNQTSTDFNVFVTECSDFSLQEVSLHGFTHTIKIKKSNPQQTQTIEPSLNQASYEYQDTIQMNLNFSDYHPSFSSGTILISYDIDDLSFQSFSFSDEFSKQASLKEANTSQKGTVTLSFVSTNGITVNNICTLAFQVKRNATFTTTIKTITKDILDDSDNPILFPENTQYVAVKEKIEKTKDGTFYLNSDVNEENYTIDTTLFFETIGNIGAGDFTLLFDNEKLKYLSSNVLVSTDKISSIIINETSAESGKLFIHIINTSEYSFSTTEPLISFHFNSKEKCHPYQSDISILGENTYNTSLTENSYNYKQDSISLLSLSHDFKTEEVPATCTKDGSITNTCTKCGETHVEKIKATGHNYSDWIIDSEPNCKDGGKKHKICSVCGDKIEEVIPAKGHSYGDWIVDKEPTCTDTGTRHKVCSECGDVVTETLDALGHDLVHHDGKPATCTESGYDAYDTCSRCGYTTYREIPAKGHSYGDWIVDEDPTCTEKGSRHRVCAVCGDTEREEIAPLGHALVHHDAKAPTCTESGYDAYDTCKRCGYSTYKEIPAKGHSYGDWVVDREPTTDEEGEMSRKCSSCGDVEKQSMPKLVKSHTGFFVTIGVISGVGVISLASLLVFLIRKKRK